MVLEDILEVEDPLRLEELGHDAVGESIEGRVRRGKDREGAVTREDVGEASRVDGGGQSRKVGHRTSNVVDGLVLGGGGGCDADGGDDGESTLGEEHVCVSSWRIS